MSDLHFPEDCLYTEDHEWVRVVGGHGTVGITDHAQKALGDVVFVELPDVGTKVQKARRFGTVESVKAVSELYSPVTGEVIEINAQLSQKPELVNSDPHGEGWLVVVEITDEVALGSLLSARDYRDHVESTTK
jgi:glycine cleavage system H protein